VYLLLPAQWNKISFLLHSFHVGSGCYDASAFGTAVSAARSVFDLGVSEVTWHFLVLVFFCPSSGLCCEILHLRIMTRKGCFWQEKIVFIKKQKTCTAFLLLCFYWAIETWVEVWENEKCCGNRNLRGSVSTAFSSSQKLLRVFIELNRKTENMFSISFGKFCNEKENSLFTLIIKM